MKWVGEGALWTEEPASATYKGPGMEGPGVFQGWRGDQLEQRELWEWQQETHSKLTGSLPILSALYHFKGLEFYQN